jgi:diaminopimelate decarboxylase
MNDLANDPSEPDQLTRQTLVEIVRRYGTPTYAFDVRRAREQVGKLRRHLPASVEILYSLKANASLGICDVFAQCGLGADVASAGELATAVEAGFPSDRIFVAGPFKLPETIAQLRDLPDAIVSVDSPSELDALVDRGVRNRLVLRLRPDFGSSAVVPAGRESRFGFTAEDLPRCRDLIVGRDAGVIGFHVFAGSQVLKAEGVIEHLRGGLRLCMRAANALGVTATLLNLGGGFGIPYGPDDNELDLAPIGGELAALIDRVKPARLALELGRYLVAQAGWYLTSVLGHQTNQGRPAVVVDGGTHQRADLCGLCLRSKARPVALDATLPDSTVARSPSEGLRTHTDVLGCLSLPADMLAESTSLPRLEPGDVLAFPNAGAYGLWSSPALFHGSPLPAEVAFDGPTIQVMRERQPAQSILRDQRHLTLADSLRERSVVDGPPALSCPANGAHNVAASL